MGRKLSALLVATRNSHKLSEIRELLADSGAPYECLSLTDAGVPPSDLEEEIEVYESFEENAFAKARYFRDLTDMPVLADDSGLCVDALGGRPGVHSRRFAPGPEASGLAQDQANNAHLLELLATVAPDLRGAHYRCSIAMVDARRSLIANGRVDGIIGHEERGTNGFGYDPLFIVPEHGRTFGELPPAVKEAMSHRAAAVGSLRRWLET